MMELNTFRVCIVVIIIASIVLVACISYRLRREGLSVITSTIPVVILGIIFYALSVVCIDTTSFTGGTEITNIASVERFDNNNGLYKVSTKNGATYFVDDVRPSDSLYLMLDGLKINESVIGIKTYTNESVLFYKATDNKTSVSERKSLGIKWW